MIWKILAILIVGAGVYLSLKINVFDPRKRIYESDRAVAQKHLEYLEKKRDKKEVNE